MIKQEPSVDLVLKILDGIPLRPGRSLIMSVARAKFEQRDTDS
jgi:HIV Tat-specific factor 1